MLTGFPLKYKYKIVRPTEQECRDFVAVSEGSTELLRKCGNPKKPLAVISTDNFLNITLHTSSDVYLKRGFVAGFSAVGCKTPPLPEDGYMSHRNATHAEFWCCVRHVFPDTMQRVKYLTCRYDMQWDKVVPDCVGMFSM
ncbi:hypothetical protein Avbf_18068 [Armadillidium vulgare]|nr:hypothetical protein Avbf_18068 [Armadillidium vulgare]